MRTLAFDVGHTTGIACLEDGKVVFTATISSTYSMNVEKVQTIIGWTFPNKIVVEKLPQMKCDAITSQITEIIRQCAAMREIPLIEIPPGIWKPVIRKVGGAPTALLKHTKDAICMAWYCQSLT